MPSATDAADRRQLLLGLAGAVVVKLAIVAAAGYATARIVRALG